jgi:hypothetical protein
MQIEQLEQSLESHEDVSQYLSSDKDDLDYILRLRRGEIPLGSTFGIPKLDEFFLHKLNELTIINGHDNVGKSVVLWYMFLQLAKLHEMKFLLYTSENRTASCKKKLLEFYKGVPISAMTEDEIIEAYKFVTEHFRVIRTDIEEDVTFPKIIKIATDEYNKEPYDALLIDPYNSLDIDSTLMKGFGAHDYHYKALREFRKFKDKYCSVYINAHAVTEALRKVFYKGHEYEGLPMPPNKSDTENGGKSSNRADNFLTIHRMTQHPTEWMVTEIHVRKIKESETGGRPTSISSPVKLKLDLGGCSFTPVVDEDVPFLEPVEQVAQAQVKFKAQVSQERDYALFKNIADEDVPF